MSLLWASLLGLLKRFSGPIMLALLLALIGVGSWAGLQKVKTTLEVNDLKGKVSEEKLNTAKVQMQYLSAQVIGAGQLAAAQEHNRLLNLGWQQQFNEAEKVRRDETLVLQAKYNAANATVDRLRLDTAAASASASVASGQPIDPRALARADATARAFGSLLQQSDSVSDGLGQDAEKLASQVRGLQAALTTLRTYVVGQSPKVEQLVGTDPQANP